MRKTYRIGSTILAVLLGTLLINYFTEFGNQSKGPLEDLFVKMGSFVADTESYFMNEKGKRAKRLKWFAPYKHMEQLKHPKKIMLGAFDNQSQSDFESILELENSLKTTFPIIHIYTAWGDKLEQRFPLTQVKAIHELGSVPMITWEPWLNDFDKEEHPQIKDTEVRDKGGLKDIANGDYDFYLKKWVSDLKQFDHPIFIRWGHEMNDPYRYTWGPQNNEPEDFIAAWKYIIDFFRQSDVYNIIWVWSPHIAYGSFEKYYPGDDYVDWVGVGTLNYGTVAKWSNWWTFDEILYAHYLELEVFKKPIIISEFGSLAVGGDRNLWYKEAFCELPNKYPNVKAVLFFHFSNDNTLTYQTLNWQIKNDSLITKYLVDCMSEWADSIFVK